jgi:N-acetylglucosamine-6-phosphate deacetylase
MFNAMVPFHHRDPGLTTAILLSDDVFVEIIGDGVHVAPEVIQLLAKIKPCDKMILISDCNPLAGQPEGSVVQFGDQPIHQTPEGPMNDEGRLAGSSTLLTDALRYLVQHEVLTFPQAIQMATYHPALHLGEFPTFGQIAPQSVADMILWRQSDLAIQSVYVGGASVPLTTDAWSQDLPASA